MLLQWSRYLLFCSCSSIFNVIRGRRNLHEVRYVCRNLDVRDVVVLSFFQDSGQEIVAVSFPVDSPFTPSTSRGIIFPHPASPLNKFLRV